MRLLLVVCLYVFALLPPEEELQGTVQGSLETSPVGRWKTFDDATGKANSIVVIAEENGTLSGRIDRLVNPDPHDPGPRCIPCEGAMKNKPLVGLRILWGLQQAGDHWSGGEITDPDSGKTGSKIAFVTPGFL